MIRLILAFVLLFLLFYGGIATAIKMSGKEKWAFTKLALYSLVCSFFAVAVMTAIVIMF
jgi:NhaP-type Na+/H+ or K+/H+ antiporter